LKVFKVKADIGLELSEIYNEIDRIIAEFPLTKQYDAIRNYLTKKPFSEEKMKLNFDCSTLLKGRDVNKEIQNLSVILRKSGKFYLAIMKKENNTLFDYKKNPTLYENPDEMEKLEYKLLP
jgi:CRISPR-associated protein Cpf1